MHYLYAPQSQETSLFDDVKQRPDRRRRHSRSSLSTRVASTSTSPSRRLPAADDDEFSYALASALASAMTIAKAETILEESFPNAFELPPPKRPTRASARTKASDVPLNSPAFVPVPAAPPAAEDNATDEWQAEYEAHQRTWRAQSAQAREKAEKERKRWEDIRAAERARGGRPREPSHAHAVAYPPASGVPSPSPADARDLVRGEPQKRQ